jgi:hypothetical protein
MPREAFVTKLLERPIEKTTLLVKPNLQVSSHHNMTNEKGRL